MKTLEMKAIMKTTIASPDSPHVNPPRLITGKKPNLSPKKNIKAKRIPTTNATKLEYNTIFNVFVCCFLVLEYFDFFLAMLITFYF